MPMTQPAARELLHTRSITIRGYRRVDGLFDIEAQLTDTKSYGFDNLDRGHVAPGEPLHGMLARLTVNEDMLIVAAEAATEYGPFAICPGGAESFARLAGLTVAPGFLKLAGQRLAGTIGCTHLRELLQQMATTALQTMVVVRTKRAPAPTHNEAPQRPRLLDSCYAYASDREAVRRRWPAFYTGPRVEGTET
jgi:hypothetical protein